MLFSRFTKGLHDLKHRQHLVEKAIAESRGLYLSAAVEKAREPILRLQDQFDEAGVDRLELLYEVEKGLPEDPYWLAAIGAILLAKGSLTPDQVRTLMRYAMKSPKHIESWMRVFREIKSQGYYELLDEARERCVLALAPFFPQWDVSHWEGSGLEDEAKRLFISSLESSLETLIEAGRTDEAAERVLQLGIRHFPENAGANRQLARIIVEKESPNPERLAFVMEALLDDPTNVAMKLWVAAGLRSVPGHSSEGVAMLRQLRDEMPKDERVELQMLECLREGEDAKPGDLPLLLKWRARNPGDLRVIEILADYYAKSESLEEEALSVYRLAAAQCRRRVAYLRLLGKASATRSDWNEVIDIFEQLREEGDEGEDVVLPLGMAYAGLGRRDADALAVYRQAIALGTREMEIHSLYCHHLYEHNRQSPESIRQFTATLSVCPDCDWAHLGLLRHYLESSDFERALEGALKLLDKEPRDREALGLAGAALAGDFSRRQLARLANARPEVLSRIFDEAYKRQPQAGPIILGRVRRRLAEDIRDEETAQLLRDACRHFPEAMDLRIERADLLWDLGQQDNAVELYRELLGRWRASSVNQIPKGMTPELRRRILFRTAGHLLTAPVLNDVEILMDAAAEPDASPEIILGAAQALVRLQADHPARIPLLEQALRLEPDNVTLERALAEGLAARGRPAPAVRLAIRLADMRKADEDTAALLRSAQAAQRPQELPPALLTALRRSLNEQTIPIPAVALAAADLIMSVRPPEEEDLGLLEYLARALPKNLRVRRWLARALSASGQDSRAAELYSTLIDDESAEPEVVIALARTHARLGMRDKAYLKVAEAAANLEPDDPDLLFHLAGIELDIGHIATAARHLDKVLEAKPEMHPRVLAALENTPMMQTDSRRVLPLTARVHIKAGRNEEALAILSRMLPNYQRHFADMMALYEELIESVPNNPRPRIERAILFRLAGRIDEAISDMRAAHLLAPDSADILHEYAEMIAQKVRSQTPADPQLCVYAGDIFLSAGDEQAALEMALLALDARKDHDPALRLKSRLELAAGRLPDCHETLRRLTDKSLAIEVFEQLARAYAEGGDSFHAAQVLTDCIEAAGPRSELLCQLRTLHQEQDRARREASMRDRLLGTLSDRARRRYELLEEIGSGAMGVVYKAYDRELDEVVVLKILPEHFAEDPEALSQFRNEAKAARKLAHPNIVRIHDFGEDGGRKHISMEYVSGGDLRQLLNRGEELSFQEKLRIVREIIRALAHAHGEGVLHRDIKAANILLTPSRRVKLSDFGIAALLTGEAPPPDDSAYVFGTPIYMSPEQFRGDRPSPATDLYSVGVLLYELMAGQPPFTRGSLSYHHQFTPPERPEAVTDVLWEVMSRLLEKEPEGRFQSAEEVLEALKLFFPE